VGPTSLPMEAFRIFALTTGVVMFLCQWTCGSARLAPSAEVRIVANEALW
jgi:hypothetical protein